MSNIREVHKVIVTDKGVKDYAVEVKNYYNTLPYTTKERIANATKSFENSFKELLYNNKVTEIYDAKFEIIVIPLIKEETK